MVSAVPMKREDGVCVVLWVSGKKSPYPIMARCGRIRAIRADAYGSHFISHTWSPCLLLFVNIQRLKFETHREIWVKKRHYFSMSFKL